MSYELRYSDEFKKSFSKITKKDPVLAERIRKKLIEIVSTPEHFKPLRNALAGRRRVHFGSLVLTYELTEQTVFIIALETHVDAYRHGKRL